MAIRVTLRRVQVVEFPSAARYSTLPLVVLEPA
jgi:hypothetical protein